MSDKFDALRHDIQYALRQIARAPGLAVAVIATFALGIGANATMFGIIDRLLLRPPAHVRAPEALQRIELRRTRPGAEFTTQIFSYAAYTDIRDHVPGFSSIAMQTSLTQISLGLGPDARQQAFRRLVFNVVGSNCDDHTKNVFDPSLRGHTDQFVYKFSKPK